jgi:hypothetical protein
MICVVKFDLPESWKSLNPIQKPRTFFKDVKNDYDGKDYTYICNIKITLIFVTF